LVEGDVFKTIIPLSVSNNLTSDKLAIEVEISDRLAIEAGEKAAAILRHLEQYGTGKKKNEVFHLSCIGDL